MKKCLGCGITLQDKDLNNIGYTPNINNDYCMRCFKTIHYGKSSLVNNIDNELIIKKINILNYFTFFITDLINLDESIKLYRSITTKKILILNKIDLLPNNMNLLHIEDNIKKSYNIEDIILSSGLYKDNLNKIIDIIDKYKLVTFSGLTSSGKSTLINKLIDSNLTTSKYDNTTLDFIKLDYLDYTIYDTPGLITSSKSINNIKYKIIKTKKDYRIIIEDYILEFSNILGITIYINDLYNIVTKKNNIKLDYSYNLDGYKDILLDGIGFIYVKDASLVYANKELIIRKSIIGGK